MNEQNLVVSHKGNKKLGKNISTISRSAGPSCPSECIHLNTSCYSQRIERIYPNVKKAYDNNLAIKDWNKIRAFLVEAKSKGNAVRIHVGGDWMMTTKDGRKVLDQKYLNVWLKALKSIAPQDRPAIWCYTHCINKKQILQLEQYGVSVYASIDRPEDKITAQKAGYKLFAYGSDIRIKKQTAKHEEIDGQKIPYCFEQINTKDSCESCDYCIKGKGDIVFLKH